MPSRCSPSADCWCASQPWAVVLLVLAGLPAFLAETKFSGEAFRLFRWRAPESRMQIYLESVLAREDTAKEVKLFQLGPRLLDRYREIFARLYREDRDLTVRRDAWGFGLGLVGICTLYGGYAWIAAETVLGAMTVGQMTMYLMLFRQGQAAVSAALSAISRSSTKTICIYRISSNISNSPSPAAAAVRRPAPNPATASASRPSSSSIPAPPRRALSGIDLHVKPGQSLALVGQNGSGKTTLIKLLTRLYQPTQGRILLDGLDLREWGRDRAAAAHRRHLSRFRALPDAGRRKHRRRRRARLRRRGALAQRRGAGAGR